MAQNILAIGSGDDRLRRLKGFLDSQNGCVMIPSDDKLKN